MQIHGRIRPNTPWKTVVELIELRWQRYWERTPLGREEARRWAEVSPETVNAPDQGLSVPKLRQKTLMASDWLQDYVRECKLREEALRQKEDLSGRGQTMMEGLAYEREVADSLLDRVFAASHPASIGHVNDPKPGRTLVCNRCHRPGSFQSPHHQVLMVGVCELCREAPGVALAAEEERSGVSDLERLATNVTVPTF